MDEISKPKINYRDLLISGAIAGTQKMAQRVLFADNCPLCLDLVAAEHELLADLLSLRSEVTPNQRELFSVAKVEENFILTVHDGRTASVTLSPEMAEVLKGMLSESVKNS